MWLGLLEGCTEEDAFGLRVLTAVRPTVLGEKILPTIGFRAPSPSLSISSEDSSMGPETVTERITIANLRNQQKVGRNEPCPCGATKNDGTHVEYKKRCEGV